MAPIRFEQLRTPLEPQCKPLALRPRITDHVQHPQQPSEDGGDRVGEGQGKGEDGGHDHDGARGRGFSRHQRAAAEQEPDRQAPGITEEDPRRVDVVKQEADGGPADQRHESQHFQLPVDRGDRAESGGGDRCDTGA